MIRRLVISLFDIISNLWHVPSLFYLPAIENGMKYLGEERQDKQECGIPQRVVDTPDA